MLCFCTCWETCVTSFVRDLPPPSDNKLILQEFSISRRNVWNWPPLPFSVFITWAFLVLCLVYHFWLLSFFYMYQHSRKMIFSQQIDNFLTVGEIVVKNTSEDHSTSVFFCYSTFKSEGEQFFDYLRKKKKNPHSHKTDKSWNKEGCIKKKHCTKLFVCVGLYMPLCVCLYKFLHFYLYYSLS